MVVKTNKTQTVAATTSVAARRRPHLLGRAKIHLRQRCVRLADPGPQAWFGDDVESGISEGAGQVGGEKGATLMRAGLSGESDGGLGAVRSDLQLVSAGVLSFAPHRVSGQITSWPWGCSLLVHLGWTDHGRPRGWVNTLRTGRARRYCCPYCPNSFEE